LIAEAAPDLMAADVPVVIEAAPVEARQERGDRDRDRDRGERGRDRGRGRDRDRGERRDWQAAPAAEAPVREPEADIVEVGTEAAPVVETEVETVTKVDDVARAVLERADRGDRKRGDKKKDVTAETREFWETWAEEKSTREPAEETAEEPAVASAAPAAESGERRSRGGRDRDKDRGRGRGRDEKKTTRSDKPAAAAAEDKAERPSRAKRDTTVTPPPAMVDGMQARLFVSLGKKHGVSADDLRELLAGPVGGDKARIGSVSLRDTHAHVRVPEDLVDQIIAGVNGTQHNEHDVTVERSRA
jgi:hypothetical protein